MYEENEDSIRNYFCVPLSMVLKSLQVSLGKQLHLIVLLVPLPNAHIMTAPVTSPLSSEYAVMAASVVNKCNAIEIERPFRIRHLVTYNFAFHYSLRQLAGGAVMNCVGGTAAILSRTKNQEPNCR